MKRWGLLNEENGVDIEDDDYDDDDKDDGITWKMIYDYDDDNDNLGGLSA